MKLTSSRWSAFPKMSSMKTISTMAIRVTRRTTNEGLRYSISGLTYAQTFRIKNAMYDCAEKMKEYSENIPEMQKDFEGYRQDALDVFNAVADGI